jgi:phospholipid/cholesterol/gamma-HCH transport system ATP-binding protein
MASARKWDMHNSVIIQVRDLTLGYGDELILRDISFDVHEGEIFVILGGSGCGKSTLMRSLIGLLKPLAGQIVIDGERLSYGDADAFEHILKKVGVLFQGSALLGSMTLEENVALPIREYADLPPESLELLVKMKLSLVNLDGYENHFPSELSGGMKKRGGLARAMALNPKILFFDEPYSGLDPVTSAELDQLILHLNKTLGTTMIIVTHELESIFAVAHRAIMLDKEFKGIIAEGDPRYLREHSLNPRVARFFKPRSSGAPAGKAVAEE